MFNERKGFSLLELVLVIALIAVAFGLISFKTTGFSFWKEEGALRTLRETIELLHTQAISDQLYYRLEFDLQDNSYRVGTLLVEAEATSASEIAIDNASLTAGFGQIGRLSNELTLFLHPSASKASAFGPSPSFPSMWEKQILPPTLEIQWVKNLGGKYTRGDGSKASLTFSPRGFSEFGVIFIRRGGDAPITILVNPFSGDTSVFFEEKDFNWTAGKRSKEDE